MKLLIDPPASQWNLSGRLAHADRAWLTSVVNESAARMKTAILLDHGPVIATGHQAWFWHPGILAKDLAAVAMARRSDGVPLHLVVDHDEHMGNSIDLPYREGDHVRVRMVTLGPQDAATPTCCQAAWNPLDVAKVLSDIRRELGSSLLVDLSSLIEAWESVAGLKPQNLAEQITAVTFHKAGELSNVPVLLASELARSDSFQGVVADILKDPARCVEAYNAAARLHPDAGIAPLRIEPGKIEVPLWAVHRTIKSGPRLRLFVKPATTTNPSQFIIETGQAFDSGTHRILPRALLLSGVSRCYFADLFVHGKGGGEYDQITDTWWTQWRNELLHPRAVVSADLFLSFDFAPVATPADLAHAIWHRHHVAHNPDRQAEVLSSPSLKSLIDEKKQGLQRIKSVAERHAKTRLFQRVHELNASMIESTPSLIPAADKAIAIARAGIANRATTARRDWYFGFYPSDVLEKLARQFNQAFSK